MTASKAILEANRLLLERRRQANVTVKPTVERSCSVVNQYGQQQLMRRRQSVCTQTSPATQAKKSPEEVDSAGWVQPAFATLSAPTSSQSTTTNFKRRQSGQRQACQGQSYQLSLLDECFGLYPALAAVALKIVGRGMFPAWILLGSVRQRLHANIAEDDVRDAVAVYPSIAAAALKAGEGAAFRIWSLLMHEWGGAGGWTTRAAAHELLVSNDGGVFKSNRRLNQILCAGSGSFWTIDEDGRIWLHGAARVAAVLKVEHLQGKRVYVPLKKLRGSIKNAKAALYSTIHASRKAQPISRATLRDLTGVAERTQVDYDQSAETKTTRNFALVASNTPENAQQAAFKFGQSVFAFVDWKGKQGAENGRYIAQRLPNTYNTALITAPKGRRKKVNRRLKDLVKKSGAREQQALTLFHSDGKRAAKAMNNGAADSYYRGEISGKDYAFLGYLS